MKARKKIGADPHPPRARHREIDAATPKEHRAWGNAAPPAAVVAALSTSAVAYADQNSKDYKAFARAGKEGRMEVRKGV